MADSVFPRICLPINTRLYLIIFFGLLLRLHDLVGAEEHQALKRHSSSKMLLGIHRLHGMLIVFAHRIIKR